MSTAFSNFDEPFAWLIRGLIEYGWTDITKGQPLPAQEGPAGFDLSFVPESQGRSGVLLRMPAVVGGTRCHEDDSYGFEVRLTRVQGQPGIAARCAECNFLQEFAFDPNNPVWMAGYLHQSLTEYVPEYVRWRLDGGELSWAQRQGVPPIEGEPCSASLAGWIQQQLAMNRTFDLTLWTAAPPTVAGVNTGMSGSPVAAIGNYGSQNGTPVATIETLLAGPARAMSVMAILGALAGFMALLNVVVTIAFFQFDRLFAIFSSGLFFAFSMSGAVASHFGIQQYRTGKGTVLPWVAIAYPALVPICCFAGLPVAIWSAKRWMDPRVKTIRDSTV